MTEQKTNSRLRKPGIILLFIVVILILVFNVIELGKYMNRKKEAEKYLNMEISVDVDKPVSLVGLMDSYGVPYSSDVPKSFFNMLESNLSSKGMLSDCIDLFNLYANKTWQLNGIFNNGVTIGEFKCLQNFSIDFNKHKFPEQIKKDMDYSTDESVSDVTLFDYVQSMENPVIIYSCTANDIFYYFGASPASLTPKKCFDIAANLNKEAATIGEHVKENLETIINCNPNSKIYVLGLYLPSDNFFLNAVASGVVDKFNKEIKKACEVCPHADYMDVTCLSFCVLPGDFHPDYSGQYILAAKFGEAMSSERLGSAQRTDEIVTGNESAPIESVLTEEECIELADVLFTSLNSYNYSKDDYVECAVAFEQALYDNDMEDLNYKDIEKIYPYLRTRLNNEDGSFDKAMQVEIAEKKMLYGIREKDNALTPDSVKNDKLSYELPGF